VNLWFDRPAIDEPFVGLPGRAMQWVFDKSEAFDGATAPGGAAAHPDDSRGELLRPGHVSLVSSGADAMVGRSNDELIHIAVDELVDALAGLRSAKLLRATVVREPRATFSLAPGQPARPSTETGVEGLWLAGDWIDTGLPATIESAVRSGHGAGDLCGA
jgi:zeta-carotene desaturase